MTGNFYFSFLERSRREMPDLVSSLKIIHKQPTLNYIEENKGVTFPSINLTLTCVSNGFINDSNKSAANIQ